MKAITHKISIPVLLEVGPEKLGHIGSYISKAGFTKIVLFFGEGIYQLFGPTVINSLRHEPQLCLLRRYDFDDIMLSRVMEVAFALPRETEAVVGIGGGKVLDAAKYVAFLNNLPFISIPTSTSHDGFASSGCSLVINGKRTSVHARMPYGIIVDLSVVKAAPAKFIYSGIGDLISKITAVYDWEFEERHGRTTVVDFAVMIAKKSVNSIVRMPFSSIYEYFFLKELVDSLTMSGIAMEIAGNSAPASGSEHLISHALDQLLDNPQLHGIQVGMATYIMSKVQNHRYQRVATFLQTTGFFDYAGTLGLQAKDYAEAIDAAPAIKPDRYTYIHLPENREKAKRLLQEDEILLKILK